MTSLDDYLRAEARDRTEPASFYVPGALSWDDVRATSRAARSLRVRQDEPDQPHLFDDPESVYDLTEGGFAASTLHPLED